MKKQKLELELAKLRNKFRVLSASQLSTMAHAYQNIDTCGRNQYMASAVTLTIKNINESNNLIVEEVIITDGLSPETIAAIKADIKRSYEIAGISCYKIP